MVEDNQKTKVDRIKKYLVSALLLVFLVGFVYSYGQVRESRECSQKVNDLCKDRYAMGVGAGINATAGRFLSDCKLTWPLCKPSNYYEPILHKLLVTEPKVSNKTVTLNFTNGGNLFYERFGGLTRSMSSAIEPGYTVIYQRNPSDLRRGDIVKVRASDEYTGTYENIVHRIVDVKVNESRTYYILKGDNNAHNDTAEVTSMDIRARVVAIIPSEY